MWWTDVAMCVFVLGSLTAVIWLTRIGEEDEE